MINGRVAAGETVDEKCEDEGGYARDAADPDSKWLQCQKNGDDGLVWTAVPEGPSDDGDNGDNGDDGDTAPKPTPVKTDHAVTG